MGAESEHNSPVADAQPPLVGKFIYGFGVLVALLHIYFNTLGTLSELWVSALHFGLFGVLCALLCPLARRGKPANYLLNGALGLLALLCAGYLILNEAALYDRGVVFTGADWLISGLAILIVIEFTRRTTGWLIPVLIVLAITYMAWWGRYLSGVFAFPGLSWETVLFRSFFSNEGMFGAIARISSTYVFMFILFGAFLVKSGAGEFIINLARCVAGRLVGGPGLVAVFGSGLMGSISGSAVANTVSTGIVTIPLMKRSGFRADFAAGIEAASSTGGQLMPPVMGAGAFVMASYTQVPYAEIIAVALLPALLYFLSVAAFVRIEAKRHGLGSVDQQVPRFTTLLREGWHSLLPIAVLVALLIYGFTPTYAAGLSILAAIVASWLSPRPLGLRDILDALADGSRNMVSTAILLIAVGLVINVVTTTGIGNTFSLMINEWSQGSLLISIVLVALASLVIGMGLPVTAAYIVLGTLSAPALYNLIVEMQLLDALVRGEIAEGGRMALMLVDAALPEAVNQGLSESRAQALLAELPLEVKGLLIEQGLQPAVITGALLSAHLIIFWLSQDSNVTPPVCLAAFAAAAIAHSRPMRTGFLSWRFAKGLYIVPLMIAYGPLTSGSWDQMLLAFAAGVFGIYALVGVLEGYLEGPLRWWQRLVLLAAAGLLLWPGMHIGLNLLGTLLVGLVTGLSWQPFRSREQTGELEPVENSEGSLSSVGR
ncbi:TRAP transporter permease [Marinobacterium arenosum]|uniref:TRAP transporter permease n=1 Tax=Marinobacterium arenosum TaxID=2862496 RepID=UPI001C953579|nr:TRAP transporter permease [Marinobacterium arenosum]MBY4677309.1 TRAP transporter permease [Marinobacterium arenosum]